MLLLILSLSIKNPIYLLLLILSCFILFSFFLFKLSLEFIVYIFLIVYIGALMMLFLFVIMLFDLNAKDFHKKNKISNKSLIFFLILSFTQLYFNNSFYYLLSKNFIYINSSTFFPTLFYYANITTNGVYNFKLLYQSESILFIFLTFLLLIAMLSSINLAMSIQKKK
jgi:NADH:ubiquinone oxidoreductase subunit 6 (subunit J)